MCGGRYVLRQRLDRTSPGGFSAVYLADDREDGIHVAVKESLAVTQAAQRRCERERRIQTRLGGAPIVRVLGDPNFGSSRCLVLEYMAGGSRADESTRARITAGDAPGIVADVLRG
jgi:serine/threonine protein kinase